MTTRALAIRAINELLAKSWKDNNLKRTDFTSDYAFARRAYLDILGRRGTSGI